MTKCGHAGFVEYAESVRSVFPDFCNTVEEMIAEDDRVAARLTYRGTRRGEILGVAATGRRVRYSGMGVFSFGTDGSATRGCLAIRWKPANEHRTIRQNSRFVPAPVRLFATATTASAGWKTDEGAGVGTSAL